MTALVAHHGTHHAALPLHSGLCLAVGGIDDGYRAASEYARRADGEQVFEISIDLDGLVVRSLDLDIAELLRVGGDYPGDTAASRAALLAEGLDAIAYDDECLGLTHRTVRLLSARALERVLVTGVYDPA